MPSASTNHVARLPVERVIEARVHGRYLVRPAPGAGSTGLLVGFHGYAEDAAIHLNALSAIPDIDLWLTVSVQALHPFYTKDQAVVANWMTRQDREHAIVDNVDYIGNVLEAVRTEYGVRRPLVFAGFSQGGAMAYRAAARYPSDALIILASDLPPDILAATPVSLPPVLIGRGTNDKWYTEAKHAADVEVLRALNIAVESCVFDGGHEWSEPFYAAAARHLRDARARARSNDR
jgi:predicted esterase